MKRTTVAFSGETLSWLKWLSSEMETSVSELVLDLVISSRVELESEEPSVPSAILKWRRLLRYDLTAGDKLIAEKLSQHLPKWDQLPPFKQRIAIRYASAMSELDFDEIREVIAGIGDSDLHVVFAELK